MGNRVDVENFRSGKNLQLWGYLVFFIFVFIAFSVEAKIIPVIGATVGAAMVIAGKFEHWYNAE